MDERMMTARELADHLRVHRKTVYRWVAAGCPCLNVSGTTRPDYRFRLDLVEEWLTTRYWEEVVESPA